jgi:hypothetical protein
VRDADFWGRGGVGGDGLTVFRGRCGAEFREGGQQGGGAEDDDLTIFGQGAHGTYQMLKGTEVHAERAGLGKGPPTKGEQERN